MPSGRLPESLGRARPAPAHWADEPVRAPEGRDRRGRGLLVLAGNEIWNAAFFGRRSPRNGFVGIVAFLGPLLALQRAVSSDRPSLVALTPCTLWVIGYDVPWTYRLWQLNRG